MTDRDFIPLELFFNPRWWHQTAGISFNEDFYLDKETRIQNDITMRKILYERFGDLGMGDPHPEPRPIIGSEHVAGGFVIPALLGSQISFEEDAAPQPRPINLTIEEIDEFNKPDFRNLWPFTLLIPQMDHLENEYGYLVGDLNTDGLLNAAYHLYGQELFLDFHTNPFRVVKLLGIIGELITDVASYVRQRSESCSISVNRMVIHVESRIFLHANCSVQMISPQSYQALHLPIEQEMAARLQPFGIHHCGNNLHKMVHYYAELPLAYLEVGWGSDAAQVRTALPDTFLNLRLDPVRMLNATPNEITTDTEKLLQATAPLDKVGVCCINMDFGTPDENIYAMAQVVDKYRRYGA